nr:hypothetical protein Iba_chr01bCG5210 [Ipomoea batatas]
MAEFKGELGFTGQCGFELWFLKGRISTLGIGDHRKYMRSFVARTYMMSKQLKENDWAMYPYFLYDAHGSIVKCTLHLLGIHETRSKKQRLEYNGSVGG